jgi:hypothetical protein
MAGSADRISVHQRPNEPERYEQDSYCNREGRTGRGRVERRCHGDVEITGDAGGQRNGACDHKTRSNAMERFRVFAAKRDPMKRSWSHQQNNGDRDATEKRRDSRYSSGATPNWVKVKNPQSAAVEREATEDWGKPYAGLWKGTPYRQQSPETGQRVDVAMGPAWASCCLEQAQSFAKRLGCIGSAPSR